MSDPLTIFPADPRGLLDGSYKRVPYHEVGQLLQEGWTILRLTDKHFHPMDRHGLMMRMPCRRLVLDLPMPPSVNTFQKDRNGRPLGNKSPGVKKWRDLCDGYLFERWKDIRPKAIVGYFVVRITWTSAERGHIDWDNPVKPLMDYLESRGIIPNDKFGECDGVGFSDDLSPWMCRVEIWPKE